MRSAKSTSSRLVLDYLRNEYWIKIGSYCRVLRWLSWHGNAPFSSRRSAAWDHFAPWCPSMLSSLAGQQNIPEGSASILVNGGTFLQDSTQAQCTSIPCQQLQPKSAQSEIGCGWGFAASKPRYAWTFLRAEISEGQSCMFTCSILSCAQQHLSYKFIISFC